MSDRGLRHNRDFQILCTAQGLSRLGNQVSGIAIPLLVLRNTHSPADAGLVGFAGGVALGVALLPGGAIADRWHRRVVMLVSDIGCAAMMVVLTAAILLKHAPMNIIVPSAVVAAALGALYSPAAAAALRLIVSDSELPTAISVSQARNAAVTLIGPPLGGLLFEISPSLPFLADAVSYGLSVVGTLAIGTRLVAPARVGDGTSLLSDAVQGMAFIYRHRFLRFTMMNAAVLNFVFSGVLLSLIVTTVEAGSTGLTTGTVIAFVGLGSLIGALLAPTAKKRLSLRQVVVMFTWVCTVMVASMALTRSIPVLAVLVGASALLVPALNVILSSAQALLTPDALQGRVQAATSFIALSISPLGVAGAGFLLARWRPAVAFLVFAGAILVLAVVSTASSSLRNVTGTPAKEPAVPVPGLAERT
jgi:hypothetical protein